MCTFTFLIPHYRSNPVRTHTHTHAHDIVCTSSFRATPTLLSITLSTHKLTHTLQHNDRLFLYHCYHFTLLCYNNIIVLSPSLLPSLSLSLPPLLSLSLSLSDSCCCNYAPLVCTCKDAVTRIHMTGHVLYIFVYCIPCLHTEHLFCGFKLLTLHLNLLHIIIL